MKAAVDTNILIGIINKDEALISKIGGYELVFPAVVVGEIYYGAFKSSRQKENLSKLNDFFKNQHILNLDAESARLYAELENLLRIKGKPLPDNDILIAAITKKNQLPIISLDKHFEYIDGL